MGRTVVKCFQKVEAGDVSLFHQVIVCVCVFCLSVLWPVHPHASHHDSSQEEDGGDASAAKSQ